MGSIDPAIKFIAEYIGVNVGAGLALILFLLYRRFIYYKEALGGTGGHAAIKGRLARHGNLRAVYFTRLRRTLDWVDGKLGSNPWNARSYEFALNLAVIYPFVALYYSYVITGENTSGISSYLIENPVSWQRATIVPVIGIFTAFYYGYLRAEGWWRLLYCAIVFAVGFAFALAVAFLQKSAHAVAFATFAALAYTAAFAVAVTVACAVDRRRDHAGTLASAITSAAAARGAFAIAGAGAFAVAARTAFPGAGAVAGAGAFSAVGIVAFGLLFTLAGAGAALGLKKATGRLGSKRLFYLCYIPSIYLALSLIAYHAHDIGFHTGSSKFLLIFFALLPVTNGTFDWLSYAWTRSLLREAANRGTAADAVQGAMAGLAAGLVLMAGLAVACTAGVQTMNWLSLSQGGPEFFDVSHTLDRLHKHPGDPSVWWVYFTLFSTLLPTAIHMIVVSASLVVWQMPIGWKTKVLQQLDEDLKEDLPLLLKLARTLTMLDAFAAVIGLAACAGLAVLAVWGLPWLGTELLWLCEAVAQALGAPGQ